MNRLSWEYAVTLPRRLCSRSIRFAKAARRAIQTTCQAWNLELLPGVQYSRFAMPLDYPPSRQLSPRYGYTHPPIPQLMNWFHSNADHYRQMIAEMKSLSVEHIARHVDDTSLPNPAFVGGPIDAFDSLALYAMIRKHRPKRYLEIGSGMTTCFARQAINDFQTGTRLISIDPQPRYEIDAICDEVVRDALETCDLTILDQLEPGDILFFDGSHRSFMNSDVTVFFIDVLPRLKPGVIIHIHDIHLPWDYPPGFVNWYWNEQYLLAVYLMNAMQLIDPLFPTAYVCRAPEFDPELASPLIDLSRYGGTCRGGGSMWFTHRSL